MPGPIEITVRVMGPLELAATDPGAVSSPSVVLRNLVYVLTDHGAWPFERGDWPADWPLERGETLIKAFEIAVRRKALSAAARWSYDEHIGCREAEEITPCPEHCPWCAAERENAAALEAARLGRDADEYLARCEKLFGTGWLDEDGKPSGK